MSERTLGFEKHQNRNKYSKYINKPIVQDATMKHIAVTY